MSKHVYVFIIAFLISTSAYTDEVDKGAAVVAKVNGTAITKTTLDIRTNRLIPRTFFHDNVSPEKRKEIEKRALDDLINEELFLQEAERQGLKVEKAEVWKRLKAIRARYPSEKAFNEAMERGKVTISMLEERIKRSLLIEKIMEKEVKVTLSDKELSDYYSNNKEKFRMPESVRVRYIWIKVDPALPGSREKAEERAMEALLKLKAGEDFKEVARNYSDHISRVKGGDVGYIHRGRFVEEVEKVAFFLKKGQLSDVIKTDTGYHIIRVEDRRPERQIPFEEIKERLRKELTDSRQKKRKTALINRLREGARIEYYYGFTSAQDKTY